MRNAQERTVDEAREDAVRTAKEFFITIQAKFWIAADETLLLLKNVVDEASLYTTGKRTKAVERKMRSVA